MMQLDGKRILLGVSGGIAAYKAPLIVRALQDEGAQVRVVMTRSATEFVTPLTLQVLSGDSVGTDLFDPKYEQQIGHIELARWPDAVLVAPATANFIGRVALGLADDLLTTIVMASRAPLVVAPAMNTVMLENPMVQANLERLVTTLGAHVVSPSSGTLACGETGAGRMPDPGVLVNAVVAAASDRPFTGRRVLLTVGPTREHIDPARFISNPSSGRMGYAMARAADVLGAEVTVVAGPTSVAPPIGLTLVHVTSAQQMLEAVDHRIGETDIAVFAAAVADVRPQEVSPRKLTKSELTLSLALTPTPDILASVTARDRRPFCVGFAAETHDVAVRSIAKCAAKKADLMIGNDVSAGGAFGNEKNSVVVVDNTAVLMRIGPELKFAVALQIWRVIADRWQRHE